MYEVTVTKAVYAERDRLPPELRSIADVVLDLLESTSRPAGCTSCLTGTFYTFYYRRGRIEISYTICDTTGNVKIIGLEWRAAAPVYRRRRLPGGAGFGAVRLRGRRRRGFRCVPWLLPRLRAGSRSRYQN